MLNACFGYNFGFLSFWKVPILNHNAQARCFFGIPKHSMPFTCGQKLQGTQKFRKGFEKKESTPIPFQFFKYPQFSGSRKGQKSERKRERERERETHTHPQCFPSLKAVKNETFFHPNHPNPLNDKNMNGFNAMSKYYWEGGGGIRACV